MLVLSRKRDEKIVINQDVVITIVEIRGDKVRIGIEAPQDIAVHRCEVWEAIQRQRAAEAAEQSAAAESRTPPPADS
jgi:carbon storage regulator